MRVHVYVCVCVCVCVLCVKRHRLCVSESERCGVCVCVVPSNTKLPSVKYHGPVWLTSDVKTLVSGLGESRQRQALYGWVLVGGWVGAGACVRACVCVCVCVRVFALSLIHI